MRRAVTVLVSLVAVAATTTACGGGGGDTAAASTPKRIAITVSGTSVTPNGDTVDAAVGQPIELDVQADAPGEIHVHSDPEHEYEYKAGSQVFTFTVDRPGVVAVESHTLDKTIVQLQVQ